MTMWEENLHVGGKYEFSWSGLMSISISKGAKVAYPCILLDKGRGTPTIFYPSALFICTANSFILPLGRSLPPSTFT